MFHGRATIISKPNFKVPDSATRIKMEKDSKNSSEVNEFEARFSTSGLTDTIKQPPLRKLDKPHSQSVVVCDPHNQIKQEFSWTAKQQNLKIQFTEEEEVKVASRVCEEKHFVDSPRVLMSNLSSSGAGGSRMTGGGDPMRLVKKRTLHKV